jgi:hypothetical protein
MSLATTELQLMLTLMSKQYCVHTYCYSLFACLFMLYIYKTIGDLPSAQQRVIYLRWLLHTVKAGEELLRHAGIALPEHMSLRREEEGIAGFSTVDS